MDGGLRAVVRDSWDELRSTDAPTPKAHPRQITRIGMELIMVQQIKRNSRRFDARAKAMASTVAITAMIAGWNLVAHLDSANAQAKAEAPASGTIAAQLATTLAPTPLGVYLPKVTPVFRSGVTTAIQFQLPPLDIKPNRHTGTLQWCSRSRKSVPRQCSEPASKF